MWNSYEFKNIINIYFNRNNDQKWLQNKYMI